MYQIEQFIIDLMHGTLISKLLIQIKKIVSDLNTYIIFNIAD